MGLRAVGGVAMLFAAGCAGGAEDESRGDGSSAPPASATDGASTGPTSTAGDETSSSTAGGTSTSGASTTTGTGEPGTGTSTTDVPTGGDSSSGESGESSGGLTCGDGLQGADEACDDGNAIDGDGCNADCRPSGAVLWSTTAGGGLALTDEALGCAVDEMGTIYVAGFMTITKLDEDVWVRSYAADGAVGWTQQFDGALGGKDRGTALAVDAAQLVYVGGYEGVDLQGANTWVRKHAADGTPVWTQTHDGPASSTDAVYAATVTAEGDLVVTGAYTVDGEGQDIWLRKYDTTGATLWTRSYSGAAGLGDVGRAV